MDFCLPKLKLPLLAMVMGAITISAEAQQSGRSIVFSSPQNYDAQSATPSLSPQNSQLPVLPSSLEAPDSAFNFHAPNDLPALPPLMANIPQDQRMKKILEERKNWALMTPAEIFGVTPTEEMLQPSSRDGTGREKNPAQFERYLDPENQLQGSLTNNWQNDRDRDGINPLDPEHDNTADAVQKLNEFLNSQRNGDGDVKHNENNYDRDSFRPPAPQTPEKPDLEQMAAMERFRQLLEPSSLPAEVPDSKFFPVSKMVPVLDPNITQPDFVPNPAGASFTPVTSGIGKPVGLTPLPGIVATPAAAPAWAPQPPPWLQQGPQPFVMPQRKF
jgi:hypothetical protein